MALAVVSKPSGYQPVGAGSLFYQFTGAAPQPNYRIVIFLSVAGSPTAEYRQDAGSNVNCDISELCRSVLSLVESPTSRLKSGYVTYQEVWDGGSNAPVALSSDVINMYVGYNNYTNNRSKLYIDTSGGLFLVYEGTKLYAWVGRTAFIDFLPSGLAAVSALIVPTQDAIPAGASQTTKIFNEFVGNVKALQSFGCKFTGPSTPAVAGFNSSAVFSTSTAKAVILYTGSADLGQGYAMKFTAIATGASKHYIKIACKKVGSPTSSIVTFKLYTLSAGLPNTVIETITVDLSNVNSSALQYVQIDIASNLTSGTQYSLEIVPDGAANSTNYIEFYSSTASTYASGNIQNKAAGVWTDDVNKDLNGSVFETKTTYQTMSVTIMEECANPIYLRWINDLGGLTQWLFDYNQLYSSIKEDAQKYPTYLVTSRMLTQSQWKMLQELNRDGDDYGDNKKLGQYLVDVTDESNPINVISLPVQSSLKTKQNGSLFQITLRYPRVSNILV